jgi:RHS repeat-associated protein
METITHTYDQRIGLGSVMAIMDEKANIVQSYEYSAFGESLSGKDAVNAFRFVGGFGGQTDDATGLVYFWNRWYDPSVGRWVSEDPIRQAGGMNLYGYVKNNPVLLKDPTGLDETIWYPVNGRTIGDGPRNGNWGGKNWSGGWNPKEHGNRMGSLPPTDSADELYMAHDIGYWNAENAGDSSLAAQIVHQANAELVAGLIALGEPKCWPHPPRKGTEYDSEQFRRFAILYFWKLAP